ncbi:hypothetical protein NDU88_002848 [Pleurodeles waltl]|uniref:DDE Tnp4 domain-containing protein n=1 Tax=Pleurodeles waltl TaxID=8319 RepID=A0AAV7RGV6_PLEWA|nr:hypothetical protein NDU88_002848 [Pleurodeles waltl]
MSFVSVLVVAVSFVAVLVAAVSLAAVLVAAASLAAVLVAAASLAAVLVAAVSIAATQQLAILSGPAGLVLAVTSWVVGLMAVDSWAAGLMAVFSAMPIFPDLLGFLCHFPTLEGVAADSTLPPVPLGAALVAGVFPLSRRTLANVLCLTGDSGYHNLSWLLIPVRNPRTRAGECYNEAHGRTRRIIERTFGLLKARFRCFQMTGGSLFYSPKKVCQIIVACCMLYNLALRRQVPFLQEDGTDGGVVAAVEPVDSEDEEAEEEDIDNRNSVILQYFQ